MDIKDLLGYKFLKKKSPELFSELEYVYKEINTIINSTPKGFENYTIHNLDHSLRVAKYMEQMAYGDASKSKISDFNAFEVALIILSALIHDIGMAYFKDDVELIKSGNYPYMNEEIKYEGILNACGGPGNEIEALKEIVRRTHHLRVEHFIDYPYGDNDSLRKHLFVSQSYNFADVLIKICRSHGEEYNFIIDELDDDKTLGDYKFNEQYIAALLRIADYIDIDHERVPMLWYSLSKPKGFSDQEWQKHFIIQNTSKFKDYLDGKKQLFFEGTSSDASIHRNYLRLKEEIESELKNSIKLLNKVNSNKKYQLNLHSEVEDKVKTDGFSYSDLRLSLNYAAITNLLMGSKIYGESKIGLREIIQNSIDACKLMDEINSDSIEHNTCSIYIILSEDNNQVIIKDNGTGMTNDIVKKHFLNIGQSFYKSDKFLYKGYDYKPIGQFGIGFLACFLLSSKVVVRTKSYTNEEGIELELLRDNEYVVQRELKTRLDRGTEIVLNYDEFFNVFEDKDNVIGFLKEYFYSNTPITVVEIKNGCKSTTYDIPSKIDLSKKYNEHEILLCKNWSTVFDGFMNVHFAEKRHEVDCRIIEKNALLFDNSSKRFVPFTTLDDDRYIKIEYPKKIIKGLENGNDNINDYPDLFLTDLPIEDKVYLYIRSEDFQSINFDDKDTGSSVFKKRRIIWKNSKLPFYNQYINCQERVYVVDGHCYYLFNYSLRTRGSVLNDDDNDHNNSLVFYYKDILVRFIPFRLIVPYKNLLIIGMINYLDSNLELDVSRNRIINGLKNVRRASHLMLYSYLKSIETDKSLCKLLSIMIDEIKNG